MPKKLLILLDSRKHSSENVFSTQNYEYIVHVCANSGIHPSDFDVEYMYPGAHQNFSQYDCNANKSAIEAQVTPRIEQFKQRGYSVILLVGDSCLKWVTGKRPLSDWHGHFIPIRSEQYAVPIYSPQVCMKQRWIQTKVAGEETKPGQFDALVSVAIEKIARYLKGELLLNRPSTLHINPTAQEAIEFLRDVEHTADATAVDIETKGVFIDCLAFSLSADEAMCIPLYLSEDSGSGYNFTEVYPSATLDVYNAIYRTLACPVPKIFQNGRFDIFILEWVYRAHVCNYAWDTLVAAHNLYADLPKDLGTLIAIYSSRAYHKHMIHGNLTQYWEYNALDAVVTHEIALAQVEEMRELGILNHYLTVTQPCAYPIIQLNENGVLVDTTLQSAAIAEQTQIQEQCLEALHRYFPDLNPGSPKQMMHVLYEVLNLPRQRRNGTVTAGKEAMLKIQEISTSPFVQMFCQIVDRYRKSQHLSGVLEKPLVNGRFFTEYNIAGTNTGRLSSKGNGILNVGTNTQNLNKGILREQLIAG